MGSPEEGRGARLGWGDGQDGDNGWNGMMAGMGVMAGRGMRRSKQRPSGDNVAAASRREFSGSVCVVRRFYGLLVHLFVSRKSAQKSLLSPCRCARREGGEIFVVNMSYRRSHRPQILLRNSYFRFKYHTQ